MSASSLTFTYREKSITVHQIDVPDNWLGGSDTVFDVAIDGKRMVAPGIWQAYKAGREEGMRMVIRTFVDNLMDSE